MGVFVSIKEILLNSIEILDQNKENFVKDPKRNFIRKRKLSFSNMIKIILSMQASSIRSELLEYFSFSLERPTPSAFIQQRDKIKLDAFRFLFYSFNSMLQREKENGNYHFYAIDGSAISLPLEGKYEQYAYPGRKDQGVYHQMHLNAIYDLQSEQYISAYIKPRKSNNERTAFDHMLEEQSFPEKSVFIFDRGYEGYPLMAHISQKNQYFVIRAKDFSPGGIVKGLGFPQSDTLDVIYDRIMIPRWKAKHKQNPDLYHRVHNTDSPYFLNKEVKEYRLAFRVVRFSLDNGKYECLLTNLPQEEFDLASLKEIYNMRWGIETSFRQLKYTLNLLGFHSKKPEYIEQEIWARLILYNFCMAITKNIKIRKNKSRYPCKANVKNAVQVCRRFFKIPIEETPPNVEQLISRELIPVRAGRKAPRKKTVHRPQKFCYRP